MILNKLLTFIKKYWTLIAIVGALFLGIFIAPRNDKDLRKQIEKEREQHKTEIANWEKKGRQADKREATAKAKARKDSIKFSIDLAASNARILKYQKQLHAINLKHASSHDLDSLVTVLYGSSN